MTDPEQSNPSPDAPQPHDNTRRFVGQGAAAHQAWILSSPSIVMAFIAVSLDLPVFLAGSLLALHHAAGTFIDILSLGWIAKATNRKRIIMLADVGVALCYLAFVYSLFWNDKVAIGIAFTGLLLLIGGLHEFKALLGGPFFAENIDKSQRVRVQFFQVFIGGCCAIAAVVIAHRVFAEDAALNRHAFVVIIAAMSFLLAGIATLTIRDNGPTGTGDGADPKQPAPKFLPSALMLIKERWFRRYLGVRLLFVMVGLSVPFFALLTAQAHKGTPQGLTALVVSSAAAMTISAPLWRLLAGYSFRLAMICGALMVFAAGVLLILVETGEVQQPIYFHAGAVFVATAAAFGITGARTLYFMQIAPKDQLLAGISVIKTLARFAIIAFTALLAGLAHAQDTLWTIALITTSAFLATVACFIFVPNTVTPDEEHPQPAH